MSNSRATSAVLLYPANVSDQKASWQNFPIDSPQLENNKFMRLNYRFH